MPDYIIEEMYSPEPGIVVAQVKEIAPDNSERTMTEWFDQYGSLTAWRKK